MKMCVYLKIHIFSKEYKVKENLNVHRPPITYSSHAKLKIQFMPFVDHEKLCCQSHSPSQLAQAQVALL